MDYTLYTRGLESAWVGVISILPNILAFLVVMLVGYYVTRGLGNLVQKGSRKVGADRWMERSALGTAMGRAGYSLSYVLGKLVFYASFLFVMQLAFGFFGPNPISALLTRLIAFLPNIFVACAIVVVATFIATAAKDIIQASLSGLSYGRFLANAASICLLVVGAFAALNQLNIAPAILNGLFYAMLAIIAGSAIVAIGGGGIVPMSVQWQKALNKLAAEAPRMQAEIQNASARQYDVPEVPPMHSTRDSMAARERDLAIQLQHPPLTEPTLPPEHTQRDVTPVPWAKG